MLSVKEAAEKFSVHKNTIYKWIRKGMPHIKVGKVIRIDYQEAKAWLENQK